MQEQTLYQIFDELSDMVIIIERKARVVHYTNRAAQHIAGIRTGDVLCPDCLPLLNESADAVFANHLDRLTLPDGTEIPVAVTRRPAEHESPPALIYLVRDLRTADGSILPDVLLADDLVDALKDP